MSLVLTAVLPIFALILAGWVCARRGILGPAATESLNNFTVWLALPALLFQAMADITASQIDHPGYLAAVTIAMAVTFALAFFTAAEPAARLADRSIAGLNGAYANAGYIGIPLCLAALGPGALVPAIIATILSAWLLFAGALILIESDLQERAPIGKTLAAVARALARNPLIVAPALGMAAALVHGLFGIGLPAPIVRFTTLLGAAASPCALVTIGLFLAQSAQTAAPSLIARIVALKLLVQPAIAWVLAFHVFAMPRLWAETAVLVSALPIGTGPFMLAKFYNREPALTSRALLVTTVVSVVTVSILVGILGGL
jgi:malonate transporter